MCAAPLDVLAIDVSADEALPGMKVSGKKVNLRTKSNRSARGPGFACRRWGTKIYSKAGGKHIPAASAAVADPPKSKY
jgi:hypothetical protein